VRRAVRASGIHTSGYPRFRLPHRDPELRSGGRPIRRGLGAGGSQEECLAEVEPMDRARRMIVGRAADGLDAELDGLVDVSG
jgi:hypothetical protein